MVQDLLFKMGIPTYVYSVETVLSGNAVEKIGDTLEITIGWVYGISVNVEGTSAKSTAINNIVTTDVKALFLNLKYGTAIYVNQVRLDHFVFSDPSAAPRWSNPEKYLPVNIPVGTDLKQSYYDNPGLLTTPKQVALNLFYIDKGAYINLIDGGYIGVNGKLSKKAM